MRIELTMVVLPAALLLLPAGCSRDQERADEAKAPVAQQSKPDEAAKETKPSKAVADESLPPSKDPCTVLTEKRVRETFSLPEDTKLERKVLSGKVPMCQYDWSEPEKGAIGLSIVPPYPDAHAAREAFKKNVELLRSGDAQKAAGGGITFQMKTVDVEGVGDMAAWTPVLAQLAFVVDNRIMYVRTKLHDDYDENLEEAKKLAAMVIGAL